MKNLLKMKNRFLYLIIISLIVFIRGNLFASIGIITDESFRLCYYRYFYISRLLADSFSFANEMVILRTLNRARRMLKNGSLKVLIVPFFELYKIDFVQKIGDIKIDRLNKPIRVFASSNYSSKVFDALIKFQKLKYLKITRLFYKPERIKTKVIKKVKKIKKKKSQKKSTLICYIKGIPDFLLKVFNIGLKKYNIHLKANAISFDLKVKKQIGLKKIPSGSLVLLKRISFTPAFFVRDNIQSLNNLKGKTIMFLSSNRLFEDYIKDKLLSYGLHFNFDIKKVYPIKDELVKIKLAFLGNQIDGYCIDYKEGEKLSLKNNRVILKLPTLKKYYFVITPLSPKGKKVLNYLRNWLKLMPNIRRLKEYKLYYGQKGGYKI